MSIAVEIKSLRDISRIERRENHASVFAGVATVEISGLNSNTEVEVQFKNASSLDAACGLVYRQLAKWGAEVAAVSQCAVGESS